MKHLSCFFVIFLIVACNKEPAPYSGPNVDLQGWWEMTDSYTGNSGGTETHQSVKLVFYVYTETDSLHQINGDLATSTKLNGLTDSSYLGEDSQLPYTYFITGNKMELRHPCDEGCRWLFTKVD